MSSKVLEESLRACQANAAELRRLGEAETDNNVKKMLLEAAHHLDVSMAEIEYAAKDSTVPV